MPFSGVACPTAVVQVVGAVSTGAPLAVIATVLLAATLPKLSTALTVIGSDPVVALVSDTVARPAFTWASDPTMVTCVVPDPVTPGPLADSTPVVSPSVTVKVSLDRLPASARPRPTMPFGALMPSVSLLAADRVGVPFTDTATFLPAAELP